MPGSELTLTQVDGAWMTVWLVRFRQVFHSVTLAKKRTSPEFPQTLDHFLEEQSLHLVLPGSPPHQKFPTERDSPTVHTPRKKRPQIIESDKGAEASHSHVEKIGLETESEEPITKSPQ